MNPRVRMNPGVRINPGIRINLGVKMNPGVRMNPEVRMYFILIKNKLEKLKITAKTFRAHDTQFNNIFSFIQFYSNYLKAGPYSYLITLL